MKVYVTARFKNATKNKPDIEALCAAVRSAGIEDFSFIRDIENYEKIFDDPRELWERSREELEKCDGLLIDISDSPSGGRVIEAGMAYGLKLPVFVVVKNDIDYKEVYDGIATKVIRYDTFDDLAAPLANYLRDEL
jgi:nucleoside 2-deoxyribosyltransferase